MFNNLKVKDQKIEIVLFQCWKKEVLNEKLFFMEKTWRGYLANAKYGYKGNSNPMNSFVDGLYEPTLPKYY